MARFDLYSCRFRFTARDSVHFPEGKSGNIIRGAFGTIFREIACVPECTGARDCPRRAQCEYARLFEPSAAGPGPSGLADWPRPFVFRASHLDGRTFAPGDPFHFRLHLFDMRVEAIEAFVLAFSRLAETGIGPRRGRAELTGHSFDRVSVDLGASREAGRLRVRFLTPTELKAGAELVERPEFPFLFNRARDRVATLRALYGPGPLGIDFRALGESARAVRMTRCDLVWTSLERRSSRTGQTHPIGGFTGEAEYEGKLGPFLPYLEAARWTGVGRQTVWGKGEIDCAVL